MADVSHVRGASARGDVLSVVKLSLKMLSTFSGLSEVSLYRP